LSAQTLLHDWLKARLAPAGMAWLDEKSTALAAFPSATPEKTVFTAFSSCVRYSGKAALGLDASALKAARAEVSGWNPSDWTCDQAARILLLLSLPPGPASAKTMDQLWQTADVSEAVALQKSVAVLANPEGHLARAREALRSNIQEVFAAITLRNPYPAAHFDNLGWNQMVVKTFFVELPLTAVEGLDRRVNAPLSRMLSDLAEERWAAGRTFSPQLWRCVGPCADDHGLANLKKVLTSAVPVTSPEKRAAALALASCPDPRAALILAAEPALSAAARDGSLTWENL
jgi:hypothetical protein